MYRIHNRRARWMTRGVIGGWKNNLNSGESCERIHHVWSGHWRHVRISQEEIR